MTSERIRPDWITWGIWLALIAGVAIYSRPILPLDETRYLSVAWEMWLRGDFLVPFKNGEPYSHKPPLLFWLIHSGWWVFGVNEWWPRLISPLLSLASTWLTWRLARRLWPRSPDIARMAPLVLLSSLLWMLYSQALFFDVLITFCALIGLLSLVEAAYSDRRRWWALFGLSVGLGVLAKGPAILVHLLPVALLAPWWLRHETRRSTWGRWYAGVGLGMLLGIAIALAWAIPAGLQGGEAYRDAIFWGQTANRVVASFAHKRPFWWYLATLPLFLFPWLFWPRLLASLGKTLRGDGKDVGVRLLLVWLVIALLIFSGISGKQPHYLLPEFPAFALSIGFALSRHPIVSRPWLPALSFFVLGLAVSYLALEPTAPEGSMHFLTSLPAWSGIGFLIAGLVALLPPSRYAQVNRLAWANLLAMLWLLLALVRPHAEAYDVTPMAREIARQQTMGHVVAYEGKYHAQYQFAGHLSRPLVSLSGKELSNWLAVHPDGVAVIYLKANENSAPYQPLFRSANRSGSAILIDRRGAAALAGKAAPTMDDSEE